MIEEMKQKIIKAAKSSGASKVQVLHGSLFVTFKSGSTMGYMLSKNLKYVLEKLLDNTTVKVYNTTNNEYAYDFI